MGDPVPTMVNTYPATTADIIKMVTMSLGLAYFLVKICSDALGSLGSKPHTKWIPGKALVLSALSLQILTYLDYRSVSISEVPDLNQENLLLGDQLVIDSGRLVICVFIGYLLPAMARPGMAEQWTDIAALVVSVFSAVVSELYYIHETTKSTNKLSGESHKLKAWFIGSSIAILVSTVMLILFLVSAIIAGKTVRGLLTQRILHVMKPSSEWSWDKFKEEIISGKCSWNKFEDEMMRSWLLCRVGQSPYVIARSVLSSSTGLMVTVCVALVVTKGIVLCYFRSFIPRNDGWDWLRHITFSLQCAFVLTGWMVICWRWWSAVLCFSGFLSGPKAKGTRKSICQRFAVEDFWTRSIHELTDVYDLHKWCLSLPGQRRKYSGIVVCIVTTFKLYRLSVFYWTLQILLVLFSKSCWFVSEMVLILFGFKFMHRCRCMKGGEKSCMCSGNEDGDDEEFAKHREALEHVCMPGESAESLWFGNAKSFKQAQDCLAYKAYGTQANGQSPCHDLKTLLQDHFSPEFVSDGDGDKPKSFVDRLKQLKICHEYKPVIEYFPFLQENNWKMVAVSLVKIIIKVSLYYESIEHPLAKVVDAYNQAWEFMTFVDSSLTKLPDSANPAEVFDIEVDQVSVAADYEWKMLPQFRYSLKRDNHPTAKKVIENIRDDAKKQLDDQLKPTNKLDEENLNHRELRDSKDWNAVAPNYYMYRVCELVLDPPDRNDNVSELLDKLHGYIADVIGNCLLELPKALVTRCREWTVEYREDDIWDALSTAGKAIKFMQEMWPGVQLVQSN